MADADFSAKYTLPYAVDADFIDARCRLTLIGIVSKAQVTVSFHFGDNRMSIPQMVKQGRTWVVSKQHFEITDYPRWKDELALQSWMEPPRGPFTYYDYLFSYREPFGRKQADYEPLHSEPIGADSPLTPFARGNSLWLLLDLHTLRPVKAEGEAFRRMATCGEQAVPARFPKIGLPESWQVSQPFAPTRLNIDLNGHVNNVEYVKYIMSWLPPEVEQGMLVKTLDTNYISSAHVEDGLVCQSAVTERDDAAGETAVVHRIVRADGSEVFRARTVWAPEATLSRSEP